MYSYVANNISGIAGIVKEYEAAVQAAATAEDVVVKESVILTSNEGSGTWGHWVAHNFPKIVLAARLLPDSKIAVPAGYANARSNFGALLAMSGLNPNRILYTNDKIVYRLDEAIFVDFLYHEKSIHPLSLDIFGEVASHLEEQTGNTTRKMYLSRTTPGKREIVNADQVGDILHGSGFRSVTLGAEPLATQVAYWQEATMVCSVLGSDLTNILFGNENCSVMAITPDWFFDIFFFDLAAAKGMVWNELYCGKMVQEKVPSHLSSFIVQEDALRNFIAACEAPILKETS
ncbi:glycosyltransferase family 61 protein [Siccirubricoccus sp. KC 17139]|uniref:Glycosyltransferase family 61 protein n=2 Tax=Siccirubricoccus soli TaxID=2899147 RepID=A0ABT1D1Y3_9PROT|nr:glycosyltransferase family 61 protein [Siccirubricoccus soli]MCP2682060.1 glycosyltransferase family 61 protein [Siccirubricoccus soli]